MKLISTWICLLLALAVNAGADAWRDTVRGGLWGAAAGALVSELSDNYEPRHTIPLFTSIGALTGYAIHKNRDAYYLPYLALPYAWYSHRPGYGYRRPAYRYYRQPPHAAVRQPKQESTPAKTVDRHPGVTLIPVPITLKNGLVIPIQILRLGERYTGPQGESYEKLPDAATLQQRYAP